MCDATLAKAVIDADFEAHNGLGCGEEPLCYDDKAIWEPLFHAAVAMLQAKEAHE